MIQPAFEILNQRGTPMFFSDVLANRPTAGIVGRIFIATDSPYGIFRDTGSGWDQIAGSGGGGISGSGAAGQVTFWTGASAVSGSNNLFFDNASGKFLVGTNNTTGAAKLQVTSSTGDDHIRVWGTTSPSIRIDNAVSGATQRFVMGLATATNNFIQGSAAGDICISTASANPLLFGMWQTTNASEVMRINTTNNLLIGTTTDAGYKVDISGTLRSTGNITVGSAPASQNLTIDTTSATQNILFYKLGQYSSYLWVDGAGLNHSSAAGGGTFLPFKGSSFSGTSCSLLAGNLNLLAGGSPNFIQFFATGVTQQGVIGYATGGTTMQFRTNGATNITNGTLAMSIFNSTNIGINTSTDAGFKLDVSGTGRFTQGLQLTGPYLSNNYLSMGTGVGNGIFIWNSYRINIAGVKIITEGIVGDASGAATGVRASSVVDARGYLVADSIGIGTNTSTINSSAISQIDSTTKGFLKPRMTTAQINAISSPASGLEVYNTDLTTPCFYDGTGWRKVSHSAM